MQSASENLALAVTNNHREQLKLEAADSLNLNDSMTR